MLCAPHHLEEGPVVIEFQWMNLRSARTGTFVQTSLILRLYFQELPLTGWNWDDLSV